MIVLVGKADVTPHETQLAIVLIPTLRYFDSPGL